MTGVRGPWRLSDFDFDLPAELIAQHPASERSASRLLVVDDPIRDLQFKDMVALLNPGDLLVFNNSRVIPARLFGTKPTGGKVEILVERIKDNHQAIGMMRVSKKPAAGTDILIDQGSNTRIKILGRDAQHEDRFLLQFDRPVLDVLHAFGEIPLPPYIEHRPDAQDAERYQTVYAQVPGSVAAPTAGLHFDAAVLKALEQKGIHRAEVTLHVGTGTFAPVRSENIDAHQMHTEWYEISQETADLVNLAKREGRRVIAVGTTSLRTLEAASLRGREATVAINDIGSPRGFAAPRDDGHYLHPGAAETDIFIRPGYQFQVVDGLLTNFHLPKSTLLMLVAAFIGYDKMRQVYQHAIQSRYRFFSYGDAMFCPRHQ